MTKLDDGYHGRFSAILPAGPEPAPERPAEKAARKAREPRTRFTCLLPPLPPEGVEVLGNGTGRRRKAAEPTAVAEPHAPEQPVEAAAARG